MMKSSLKFLLVAVIIGSSILPVLAQDAQKSYIASGVYNVRFVVSELENGKVINQRVYTEIVREERKAVLKTGNRVPVATGSSGSANNPTTVQWQYLDVGFNVDATVSEREGRIDVDLSADLSAVVPPDSGSATPGGSPLLRQVRQAMNTSVEEGKPTVVASLDDVSNKKTVQLEITVTRVRKGHSGM
jgi:hypothetical protein